MELSDQDWRRIRAATEIVIAGERSSIDADDRAFTVERTAEGTDIVIILDGGYFKLKTDQEG